MKNIIIKNEIKLYGKNDHKIYHGDSLIILEKLIKNESIDLIISDPPYNIGKNFNGIHDRWDSQVSYLTWTYKWIDLCIKKLKENGSIYIMCSTQTMPYIDIYLQDKLHILSRIIWFYDSSSVQAKNHFGSMYEPIIFAVKDKNNYIFNSKDILVDAKTGSLRNLIDHRNNKNEPYNSKKVPGNIWFYHPRVRYRMKEYEEHPTQKPEELIERIIKASCKIKGNVLDPFAGSFTVSSVAKKLKRKSIGIEINSDYVKIGLERLGIK